VAKASEDLWFHQQKRIPYRDDLSIRAQLTIIAQPAGFDEWASTFPTIAASSGNQDLSFKIAEGVLIIKVALSPQQHWRPMGAGRRAGLFIEVLPFLSTSPGHWFDLRVWIVFHELSSRPIPDVRVWTENNLVLPGGRPESDRRRF